MGRDAGRAADEVISHLTALVGSEVTITLEIEAQVPNGIPENTVRTVTENSRTLKFDTHGNSKKSNGPAVGGSDAAAGRQSHGAD